MATCGDRKPTLGIEAEMAGNFNTNADITNYMKFMPCVSSMFEYVYV